MIKLIPSLIIVFFLASGYTTAQKILTFDFHNLTVGDEVTANSNYNDINLDTSTISRGTGVTVLDANWLNVTGGTLDPGLFNSYRWTTGGTVDLNDYLEFIITPNSGYQFAISSIKIEHERNGAGPTNFVLRTSNDGFSSNLGGIHIIPEVQSVPVGTMIAFPMIILNTPLTIRLYAYGSSSTNGTWGVGIGGSVVLSRDNITVNGFVTTENSPSIFISKNTLSDFSYFIGTGASALQSFNIIGSDLTGDLTVTGSANYEVSLDGSNFLPSVLVINTGGNVSSTPIYVRLKSGLTASDYNESITITGGGATQRQINCTGFVSPYNLVINEILSDAYPSGSVDSNNDGASNYVQDQFIEFVNIGTSTLNLTAFTIKIFSFSLLSTSLRHTFNPGTILPVNDAIVVFGGGSLANFSISQAQIASTGGLRLNEPGGIVTISDNLNRKVAIYTYGPESAEGESIARNPDFIGPFVKHSTIITNPVTFSAGKDNTDASPLPVELSSFSAIVLKDKVKLVWRTDTEVNNYGFEVEKTSLSASPLRGWEKIGFVDGNGNSNSPKDYFFEDNSLTPDKYSYRLKQIDNDGKYNYSEVIEVDLSVPIKFELSQNYPNPFNPSTSIKFSLPEAGQVRLTVFNVLGEEVAILVNENKEAGVHTINFNGSELNSGLYIYKIEAKGNLQSRKMMLLK